MTASAPYNGLLSTGSSMYQQPGYLYTDPSGCTYQAAYSVDQYGGGQLWPTTDSQEQQQPYTVMSYWPYQQTASGFPAEEEQLSFYSSGFTAEQMQHTPSSTLEEQTLQTSSTKGGKMLYTPSSTSGEQTLQTSSTSGGQMLYAPSTSGEQMLYTPSTSGGQMLYTPSTSGGHMMYTRSSSSGGQTPSTTFGAMGGQTFPTLITPESQMLQIPSTSGGQTPQTPSTLGYQVLQTPSTSGGQKLQSPGTSGSQPTQNYIRFSSQTCPSATFSTGQQLQKAKELGGQQSWQSSRASSRAGQNLTASSDGQNSQQQQNNVSTGKKQQTTTSSEEQASSAGGPGLQPIMISSIGQIQQLDSSVYQMQQQQMYGSNTGGQVLLLPVFPNRQLPQQACTFSGQMLQPHPPALQNSGYSSPANCLVPAAYLRPLSTAGQLFPVSPDPQPDYGNVATATTPGSEYILVQLVPGGPPFQGKTLKAFFLHVKRYLRQSMQFESKIEIVIYLCVGCIVAEPTLF